jgi:hypothetical protein
VVATRVAIQEGTCLTIPSRRHSGHGAVEWVVSGVKCQDFHRAVEGFTRAVSQLPAYCGHDAAIQTKYASNCGSLQGLMTWTVACYT